VKSQFRVAREWRSAVGRIGVAFIIALSVASTGQTAPAQAAPAGATELGFFLVANKQGGSKSLCVGELSTLQVLVYRQKVVDGVSQAPDVVTGVRVNGVVTNPSIGKISPERNMTILASSIYPGAADFVFTAARPGATAVVFEATVVTPGWFGTNWGGGSRKVSAHVDVQVIACKFKVTTKSLLKETVLGTSPAYIHFEASSTEAELVADEQGNYTGSTKVDWVSTIDARRFDVPGGSVICAEKVTTMPSQVDWAGTLNDQGYLALTGTFPPTTSLVKGTCGPAPISDQGSVTPDPLNVLVPFSTGGASTLSQVLEETNQTGSAFVDVVPTNCSDTASC
jgi:hypothetical protein